MSKPLSALLDCLTHLSKQIGDELSTAHYTPPDGSDVSVKSTLLSLLQHNISSSISSTSEAETQRRIKDLSLCCAALASAADATYEQLLWIPKSLSEASISAFKALSNAYYDVFDKKDSIKIGELELDAKFLSNEKRLVIELMPQVLPLLKDEIKESAIDTSDDLDRESAATARVPVTYAIVAAYQFRWLVTQVGYPYLGKLCALVIPCALTALDHWSPEVKGQGMVSFIHLAQNMNAAEIGVYEDVVLDACCQNIASSYEIWDYMIEMSVLLVTSTQRSNPRSVWYEKLLNEMLSHLERQPRNKERRIAWLKHIEPFFSGMGLFLLAHFRRIFPLFFKWMHSDDDDTVLLVLERMKTVIQLTWIRNSPYFERLVDELVTLHKEAALRIAREDIRALVLQILILIQQSKGSQFEAAWDKHKNDPDLTALAPPLVGREAAMVKYSFLIVVRRTSPTYSK